MICLLMDIDTSTESNNNIRCLYSEQAFHVSNGKLTCALSCDCGTSIAPNHIGCDICCCNNRSKTVLQEDIKPLRKQYVLITYDIGHYT